jgi:mannose-6-phosphate isomerase-like protein (cupin superfamily)
MDVVAADGMPVRVLPLAGEAFMGAAIGFLAPRARYAVHFHYALEQLTFVLRGSVVVTTDGRPRSLAVGEAITNPPGVTLSFANEADEPAEVLFVCAPPFPSQSTHEVGLPGEHRPLTDAELDHAQARMAWAIDHFRHVAEARRGAM